MKNYIYIFLIAMVPLIELRGALPVAYGIHTANPDFSLLWSYIIIAIGNMLPVPFIFFFARKVLEWGKDVKVRWFSKFCIWCLEKGEKGGQKLQAKAGRGLYVALLLFVGIPLPGRRNELGHGLQEECAGRHRRRHPRQCHRRSGLHLGVWSIFWD